VIWLFFVLALAQESAAEPVETTPAMELTVWGEAAIRHARYDIVRGLEDLGWTKTRELDGAVRFRPPAAWMGKATLTHDGDMLFHRPVLAMKRRSLSAPAPRPQPEVTGATTRPDPTYVGGTNAVQGHDAGTFWVLPSWRLLGPAHERTHRQIEPLLLTYRQIIEDTAARQAP
jgi:hypothetical protein